MYVPAPWCMLLTRRFDSWLPTTTTVTGTLPAKLGELSELEKLDLWDNFLEGIKSSRSDILVQNFLYMFSSVVTERTLDFRTITVRQSRASRGV